MIGFFKGGFDPPRDMRNSRRIQEGVHIYEHSRAIQFRKEGVFQLNFETVRMPANPYSVLGEPDSIEHSEEIITSETLLGPLDTFFSPLLLADFNGDLSIDNFPDGFAFGNGGTGHIGIPMTHNGVVTQTSICWTIFPVGTVLDNDQVYRLQELIEGVPPGSPERNVWRQFNEAGELDS